MNLVDGIVLFAIIVIVGGAVAYLVREKRRGKKCIGCPFGDTCQGKCNAGGCGKKEETK